MTKDDWQVEMERGSHAGRDCLTAVLGALALAFSFAIGVMVLAMTFGG